MVIEYAGQYPEDHSGQRHHIGSDSPGGEFWHQPPADRVNEMKIGKFLNFIGTLYGFWHIVWFL